MTPLSLAAQRCLDAAMDGHGPPPGARAAVRARLLAGGPASLVAEEVGRSLDGAGSRAGPSGPASGVVAALAGALVGAAVGTSVATTVPATPPRLVSPAPWVAPRSPTFTEHRFAKPDVAPQKPRGERAPAHPVGPKPLSEPGPKIEPAPSPAPEAQKPSSSLAEEARLLAKAKTSLRDGDFAGALALADAHAERFPEGLLLEERRVARATALCRLGRQEEGRLEIEHIRKSSPGSVALAALAAQCGQHSVR